MDLLRPCLDDYVEDDRARVAIDEFLACAMRHYASEFDFCAKTALSEQVVENDESSVDPNNSNENENENNNKEEEEDEKGESKEESNEKSKEESSTSE